LGKEIATVTSIGYLGPQGSFSEEALYSYLQQNGETGEADLRIYPSIPQLLKACAGKEIDMAFLPLENSTEGQVTVTADMLRETEDLYIVAEYIHPITHCLIAARHLPLSEITRVYSHEQALAQCRNYLERHLPLAEQISCVSTSEAARKVSLAREKWAAIGPRRAAELYNLHCLAVGIEDYAGNATRFILVGRHLAEMSADAKTSILFATPNTPGALCKVITEFAARNINLTRIESRPSKVKLGEYVFFIDFDGYVYSPEVQDVLWALKKNGVWVKLLGSYPKAKDPWEEKEERAKSREREHDVRSVRHCI